MSVKAAPWYECWAIKVVAVAIGGLLLYMGQLRYERGLRAEEIRNTFNPRYVSDADKYVFLGQVDFVDLDIPHRRRLLNRIGVNYFPSDSVLACVRGIDFLTTDSEGPVLANVGVGRPLPSSKDFEIDDGHGHSYPLLALTTSDRHALCLCLPYTSAAPLIRPTLRVIDRNKVVQSFQVRNFSALPHLNLGADSKNVLAEIAPVQPNTDFEVEADYLDIFSPIRPVQYHVQLKIPVPPGQHAFAKILSTDYSAVKTPTEWKEIGRNGAYLDSPSGLLATQAKIGILFAKSTQVERTISTSLGQVAVQYGQPTFLSSRWRRIPVTPQATLLLLPQGINLKRPPKRVKNAIHISAFFVRNWADAPGVIPPVLKRVDWLSPNPAALGLDAVWLPWGKIAARSLVHAPPKNGPLSAKLKFSLEAWQINSSMTTVATINTKMETLAGYRPPGAQ